MATFSTQFHAHVDELAEMAVSWLARQSIFAVGVSFHPFAVVRLDARAIDEAIRRSEIRRIVFTAAEPLLGVRLQSELLDKNQGSLLLDIGRMDDAGLRESCLSTMAANPTWRRINQDLKHRTLAGAIAVNEKTGATSQARNHRYTAGALALFEAGVTMLPIAGTATLRFLSEKSETKG